MSFPDAHTPRLQDCTILRAPLMLWRAHEYRRADALEAVSLSTRRDIERCPVVAEGDGLPRKRRTREHIIADLSANHVERYVLSCGFSVERIIHDYGIDLVMFTYTEQGEFENGQVFIQLKATDRPRLVAQGRALAVSIRRADLELWLSETMPWILIVYDAARTVAYWLYVQAYFESLVGFDVRRIGRTTTAHVPLENVIDDSSIRLFATFRDRVLRQVEGVVRHHA